MTKLGRSDLDVAPLALGTNTFGWTSDEATSHAVLDAFLEGGGTMVDTADSYSAWAPGHTGGESETVIGSWLRRTGRRDDVVIATKIGQHPARKGLAPDTVKAAAEDSLGRLGVERVDVLYAHFDDPSVPLAETLGALDALVVEGKVREVAVSNYEPARIEEWVRTAAAEGYRPPVALQPQLSLVHRREYEDARQQLALDHDLGVLPYWALASGFLTGKYRSADDVTGDRAGMVQGYADDAGFAVVEVLREVADAHGVEPAAVALAWVRSRPGVVAPIASARSVEQLAPLLAGIDLRLADDEVARLTAVSDAVGR